MEDAIFQEVLFPKTMMIEVSNICNHSCIFCSNKMSERKRTLIDEELCLDVLDKAYDLGVREVSFHGMGEPFTNSNLEKYIKHAKRLGYSYIYVDTNGALATPDRLKSVILAGLDSIKFSVAGAEKETYKKVHGKDDFDKVIGNIEWLIDWKECNNSNIKIIIDYCLTTLNRGQEIALENRFRGRIDDFWVSECSNQAAEMDNSSITVATSEALSFDEPDNQICIEPFYRFVVTANGYADACCMDNNDNLVYADLNIIRMKSKGNYLIEAWEMGKTIRNSHRSGIDVPVKCINCEYTKYYQKMGKKNE